MNKLKWKELHCDDLSASWLEAIVKPLQWTYVIDEGIADGLYSCFLFMDQKTCEEIRITSKNFKTIEKAQEFCEKHLEKTYLNLKKLYES